MTTSDFSTSLIRVQQHPLPAQHQDEDPLCASYRAVLTSNRLFERSGSNSMQQDPERYATVNPVCGSRNVCPLTYKYLYYDERSHRVVDSRGAAVAPA